MTVDELMYEWLYENHKDEIKERTLLRYECTITQNILPIMGSAIVEDINPRNLQKYINEIKIKESSRTHKPLSSSTINTIIAILKLAFSYAVDFEIIKDNPTLKIKRVANKEATKINAFTRDEQIRIENYIERLHNDEYFGIILVLYTGLRIGELLALTWKDINLKTGIISISKTMYKTRLEDGTWEYKISTPKSRSSIREIPIPNFLKDKLKELKKQRRSKYIVCKNDGSVLNDKLLTYRFRMILKRVHVRRLTFHSLRHTFATRALENKMDIKTLSEILGHSSAATTLNIYAHSLMDHKKTQMRKFKRLI